MTEIVFPKNNEEEFIGIASRIGIKNIIFIYDIGDFKNAEEKVKTINTNIGIETGIIVTQKSLKKAASLSKFLIAKSSPFDRLMIESKKMKLIYGFEELGKKDFMHQRASGLNHINAELARKNNTIIGFSYGSLIRHENPSKLMGRIAQNMKICRKYRCKTLFASFSENPFDLRASYEVLSLSGVMEKS